MVLANALLIVPEGQFETPAGATVQALVLDDPAHQARARLLNLSSVPSRSLAERVEIQVRSQ